jgi:hypothetical protein
MRFNGFGLKNKMEREINIYINESGRYKFNYTKKKSLTDYENIDYENEFDLILVRLKDFQIIIINNYNLFTISNI